MEIQKTNSVNFKAGLVQKCTLNPKIFGAEINKFIGELSNALAPQKGCDVVEISAKQGRRILVTKDGQIHSLTEKKTLEATGTAFEQARNNLSVVTKKGKEVITGITNIDLTTPTKFNASLQRVLAIVEELI